MWIVKVRPGATLTKIDVGIIVDSASIIAMLSTKQTFVSDECAKISIIWIDLLVQDTWNIDNAIVFFSCSFQNSSCVQS